jgi:hypothetical protein
VDATQSTLRPVGPTAAVIRDGEASPSGSLHSLSEDQLAKMCNDASSMYRGRWREIRAVKVISLAGASTVRLNWLPRRNAVGFSSTYYPRI